VRIRSVGAGVLLILVGMTLICSMMFGIVHISLRSVLDAIWSFDGSRDHLVVTSVRVPRAIIGAVIGAALAVAGCLMQGLSRNALASPELFGINYGAALAVVITSFILGTTAQPALAWSALLGAALSGGSVLLLSALGRVPLSPVKLLLAGATINLLLSSMTQGILILHEQSLDTMRFWLAGSLTGRDFELFIAMLPYITIGLITAFCLSNHLNVISLGDDVAHGLGQRIVYIKICCVIVIVLLAGSAVAVVGPIGFVGLAVPHIARLLVGTDYRWIILYSALLGALLLSSADIAARFIIPAQEVPAGVVTAFFGAPFLMFLAQRKKGLT
jgi:iron complex transport system permease protein